MSGFPSIVSKSIRVRVPGHFEVGEGSIVDDYCYFSTRVRIGRFSHIANGCSVAGGKERTFTMGDFGSLSAGVKIWCTSDDFVRGLVTIVPAGFGPVKEGLIEGDVTLERFCAVGANSVVMPGNHVPEGTTIGALSFVPAGFRFEAWSVYAGAPVRKVSERDRESVLRQFEAFSREMERDG